LQQYWFAPARLLAERGNALRGGVEVSEGITGRHSLGLRCPDHQCHPARSLHGSAECAVGMLRFGSSPGRCVLWAPLLLGPAGRRVLATGEDRRANRCAAANARCPGHYLLEGPAEDHNAPPGGGQCSCPPGRAPTGGPESRPEP
ncbi:unnamed protein product, partial [Symbiodinium sp. CCMP2456]